VTFYENTKDFLKPHRPLTKFLAIKFVIFFCFWQGIGVSGLVKLNLIHSTTYWTADNVSSGVQNTLVCCEMVIAAMLHIYAFSYKPYVVEGQKTPVFKSFLRVIYLKDVVIESKKHIVPDKIKNIITKEEIEMIPIEIVNEQGDVVEVTAIPAKSVSVDDLPAIEAGAGAGAGLNQSTDSSEKKSPKEDKKKKVEKEESEEEESEEEESGSGSEEEESEEEKPKKKK